MYASDRERLFFSILIAVTVWAVVVLLLWKADLIPEQRDLQYQGPLEVVLDTAEMEKVARSELPPEEDLTQKEAEAAEETTNPGEKPSQTAEESPRGTETPQAEPGSRERREEGPGSNETGLEETGVDKAEPDETLGDGTGPAETGSPGDTAPGDTPANEVIERSPKEEGSTEDGSAGTGESTENGSAQGDRSFFDDGADLDDIDKAVEESDQPGREAGTESQSDTDSGTGNGNTTVEVSGEENPLDPKALGTNVFLVFHPEPDISEYAKDLPPTITLVLSFIVSPGGVVSDFQVNTGSGNSNVDRKIAAAIQNDWKFTNKSGKNVRVYLKYTTKK